MYGLILALIGAGVGFFIYNKPHQNMNKAQVDLQLSATQLFNDYDSDETTANTKYLDKVVQVKGTVKEVNTDESGTTSVTLESGSDMFGVVCQMDNLTEHERTAFSEGEQVTFKGICTGSLMDVVLVRCVEI